MTNINYADKNQRTISIAFDTVEQRQQLKQLAESLKCSEEELGKQLILERLNNSPLVKLKDILEDGCLDLLNLLREEEELAAMANDPEIKAEIAAMNQEFAVTEMDGLENL